MTKSINSFGCDDHGCSSPDRQGLLAQGQLGNLEGNEKDVGPNELAQLMQEYSLAETDIMSILSLGELIPDLIVDRGENRTRVYAVII